MKTKMSTTFPIVNKPKKDYFEYGLSQQERLIIEQQDKYERRAELELAITRFENRNIVDFPQNVHAAFEKYYSLGFGVIPLIYGQKIPKIAWSSFQHVRIPFSVASELFLGSVNIGVSVGTVSNGLFVVDCDSRENFEVTLKMLQREGHAKWVVETTRGGHFWFLAHDCFVNNHKLGDMEIWGKNRYVVAPPSVMEDTGFVYSWIKKEGQLPPKLDYDQIRDYFPYSSVTPNSDYPAVAYQVLVKKDTKKYNGDNSSAEYAAVISFVRRGWSDSMIIEEFKKHPPSHFAKRDEDVSWLKKVMISKARRKYAPKRNLETINKLISWSNQQQWKGITGSTDKRVFLACLDRAKYDNENTFRATNREIAIASAVELKTVRKSVKRLVAAGFLEFVSISSNGTYLRIPKKLQQDPSVGESTNNGVNQLDLQRHDVWRKGGLGYSSLEIYLGLQNSPNNLTPQEIQSNIGKHISTIYRNLILLEKYGLITKEKGKYSAIPMDENRLDKLAEEFGLLGKSEAKKSNYEAQRAQYAWGRQN